MLPGYSLDWPSLPVTKCTCDWTIARSLIGEWTSKEVFLPPVGEWPRNGHSKNLLEEFDYRRPSLLTWARACFEQGSFPPMLHLSGDALLCVLPGDRMFQAQRLVPDCARPVILHGYGGAKRDIPKMLPTLAAEGWVPMAHAMVGYRERPPAWCRDDLRPVMGTSCDFRLQPDPLTHREQPLLLSQWRRVRVPCLPNQCALRTWLANKADIPTSHGPDHDKSPHAVDKDVLYEPLFKSLAMLAATTDPPNGQLSPTKERLLALRMVAFGLSMDHLETLTSLLLSGRMTYNFLHDRWTAAVQDYLDGKPLMKSTLTGDCLELSVLALVGMTWVDHFCGTSVFVLIAMGRIFMAHPWLPLRPLHIIPTEDQGTQWPLASLKPCMSSSCCTTLLQIVLQDGMT